MLVLNAEVEASKYRLFRTIDPSVMSNQCSACLNETNICSMFYIVLWLACYNELKYVRIILQSSKLQNCFHNNLTGRVSRVSFPYEESGSKIDFNQWNKYFNLKSSVDSPYFFNIICCRADESEIMHFMYKYQPVLYQSQRVINLCSMYYSNKIYYVLNVISTTKTMIHLI